MLISQLFASPTLFFLWILAILIALAIHEYAHAFAAHQLGDDTSKHLGRLTLNPFAHVDWLGMVMLMFVGFGWGKPVPVDTRRLKYPKWGEALVAAAGPFSNLLAIIVFGLFLQMAISLFALPPNNLLILFLFNLLIINIILMVFNLLPIPPLDGSKVLFAFLPAGHEHIRHTLEHSGPMILFTLLILDYVMQIGIFASLFRGIITTVLTFFS